MTSPPLGTFKPGPLQGALPGSSSVLPAPLSALSQDNQRQAGMQATSPLLLFFYALTSRLRGRTWWFGTGGPSTARACYVLPALLVHDDDARGCRSDGTVRPCTCRTAGASPVHACRPVYRARGAPRLGARLCAPAVSDAGACSPEPALPRVPAPVLAAAGAHEVPAGSPRVPLGSPRGTLRERTRYP